MSIVHESEVQRQHVRLQLPMRVHVGNESCIADDWSNSGVAIKWTDQHKILHGDHLTSGQMINAVLGFSFDGFNLTMPMQLEVRYIDKRKERVGFRFVDLNPRSTSLLRYVVGAYVSGEMVRAGDVIHIAGRHNFMQPRKIPAADVGLTPMQRLKNKLRRSALASVVTVLSLAAFGYVVLGMYERVFVVTTNAAQVTTDYTTLASPVTGRIYFQPDMYDKQVKKGTPLAMVKTDTGNMAGVDSSCDCIVKARVVENEAMVSRGDVVLRLVPQRAATYVETRVPAQDAVRLAVGKRAVLEFPGHDATVQGKITAIRVDQFGAPSTVLVQPEKSLPVEWVDDPVSVRFDTLLFD